MDCKDFILNKTRHNDTTPNINIKNDEFVLMLKTILKKSLGEKLLYLEKNTKKHFSLLNLSLSTTKYLTNLSSTLNKEINKNQNNNQKQNRINKLSKSIKKLNFTGNNFRSKEYKTIIFNTSNTKRSANKTKMKNNTLIQRFRTESKTINFEYNKRNLSKKNINKNNFIFNSPNSLKTYIIPEKNNNKLNNINNSSLSKYISTPIKIINNQKRIIYHSRNLNSMDSNISNMTSENSSFLNNNLKTSKFKGTSLEQTSYRKKNSKNKKLGLIGRLKRSIDKCENKKISNKKGSFMKEINNIQKKTGNKIKNKSSKKVNDNIISNYKSNSKKNTKKRKNSKMNKDNIIKNLEQNWKQEENLINKDPLLITSMKDLEFVPKELMSINISREELNVYINKNKDISVKSNNDKIENIKEKNLLYTIRNYFKLENLIFEEFLPNIMIYLTKEDILQLKNCSKYFSSFIINYYIKLLDKEKIFFLEKQNKLNVKENEITQKLDIKNLILNKGTLKAIKLLNEEIFCRLFYEDKTPNKDILLVYKLYFQIISFKEITNQYNKTLSDDIFWDECRNYFKRNSGNISDILINNIENNKILLTGENLYKIYKCVENNIYKFNSGYFSKLCGTTGLFIFYIRDILDFLGFSSEIKFQKNSYCSFFEIIKYIDYKINTLNTFSLKLLAN